MRTVELQTRDGKFVACVEITPFPDPGMPEIVAWGDRIFLRSDYRNDGEVVTMPGGKPWPYREVVAHISFTKSPGLPRG